MQTKHDDQLIFGRTWSEIDAMQNKRAVNRAIRIVFGDYGADPLGDGTFRMVPSGDIVDFNERERRLRKVRGEV